MEKTWKTCKRWKQLQKSIDKINFSANTTTKKWLEFWSINFPFFAITNIIRKSGGILFSRILTIVKTQMRVLIWELTNVGFALVQGIKGAFFGSCGVFCFLFNDRWEPVSQPPWQRSPADSCLTRPRGKPGRFWIARPLCCNRLCRCYLCCCCCCCLWRCHCHWC